MYKTISLIFLLTTIYLFADIPFGYRTIGIDVYSDGSVVNDGECYALVWSKDVFKGFFRDGSKVSSEDEILYIRPIAKNGKCPPVNFMISDEFHTTHKNGTYSVVLLDTRDSTGNSCGIVDGSEMTTNNDISYSGEKLVRVNSWAFANKSKTALKIANESAVNDNISTITSIKALLPDSARKPKIVDFQVSPRENMIVDFIDAEIYLSYFLEYGDSLNTIGTKTSIHVVDGQPGTNTLILTQTETKDVKSLFMRVKAIDFEESEK